MTQSEKVQVGTFMTAQDVVDHAICLGVITEEEAERTGDGVFGEWLERHGTSIVDQMVAAAYGAIEQLLYQDPIGDGEGKPKTGGQ